MITHLYLSTDNLTMKACDSPLLKYSVVFCGLCVFAYGSAGIGSRSECFGETSGWRQEPQTLPYKELVFRDTVRQRSIPARIYCPPNRNGEKLPVVVFSHGLGGSPECCSYLGVAWASRGFFVVMLQHPGSDEEVWKGKIRIMHELEDAYRTNWSGRTRARDIRVALDSLELLASRGDTFVSQMDFGRIGVGGYDLGSLAALLLAGQLPPDGGASLYDQRIKAVLAMSPPVNKTWQSFSEIYAPISVPVFFITGTADDGIIGTTQAHQRRIPFDALGATDRYLVTLRGADHRVYGSRILSVRARNDKPFQSLIVRTSTCFWQAVLQEKEAAQSTLNGYGLNALLSGMARLERRLVSIDPYSGLQEAAAQEPEEQDRTPASDADREIEPEMMEVVDEPGRMGDGVFPTTRLYRVVSDKYLATSP